MKTLLVIAASTLMLLATTPLYAQEAQAPVLSCTTGAVVSGSGLQIIGQPRVVQGPYSVTVNGRVRNPSDRPVTGIITVTLFDENAGIVGVYTASAPAIAAGDEVTYTALGADKPDAWAAVEAKIAQQF